VLQHGAETLPILGGSLRSHLRITGLHCSWPGRWRRVNTDWRDWPPHRLAYL